MYEFVCVYMSGVCRVQKKEKRDADGNITYRIRGTAGEDKIHNDGRVSALTADMPVVKLLHNGVQD